MKNKKNILYIIILVFILLSIFIIILLNKNYIFKKHATKLQSVRYITVVATKNDKITEDSIWSGTFQLAWNDLKNEIAKQNIVFDTQPMITKNLNKEDFSKSMMSKDLYLEFYGLKTLELKSKIENEIKNKFNQTSDILYRFDWSNVNDGKRRYFLYSMLYNNFQFLEKFDKLNNGTFRDKYGNIEYFGIDENTENKVRKQVKILYYNSSTDFAISINTKENDQLILVKSPEGETFNEIYKNVNAEAKKYRQEKNFGKEDELKIPILRFNVDREYSELQNKEFKLYDSNVAIIDNALQNINFNLDEKGGTLKSESGIEASTIGAHVIKNNIKYFYFDDTFSLFLKKKDNNNPYFAVRIDNIDKFQ